jgi:uncharacterized membrane protein
MQTREEDLMSQLARIMSRSSVTAVALLLACHDPDTPDGSRLPTDPGEPTAAKAASFASLTLLPTLSGRIGEALAVNAAGTVVVGSAWERGPTGTVRAVRWTQGADGSWVIAVLPEQTGSTGATARGVDDQGNAAGNDFPASTSDAVLWPAGGTFTVLSCAGETGEASVYAISGGGQAVVGSYAVRPAPATAGVWRLGGCREDLPTLAVGGWARASAANGDGTIVGGAAALTSQGEALPVRWTLLAGQWQAEQLGQRPGSVHGANGVGDLAGVVNISCGVTGGCQRAIIWSANGGSHELGTLGGSDSWAHDINAAGEVVGGSTSSQGNTGYFWSESTGMLQLPAGSRCCAAANAVSDIRQDGTRLVAGLAGRDGRAAVWVVRPPATP